MFGNFAHIAPTGTLEKMHCATPKPQKTRRSPSKTLCPNQPRHTEHVAADAIATDQSKIALSALVADGCVVSGAILDPNHIIAMFVSGTTAKMLLAIGQ